MKKSSFGRFFRRVVILCFMALCVVPGVADNITTSPVDCNSATLNTATGPATLNAQWQANEIDIDWYSDNVKITNDPNAATTCTYDETFTLPTPPTKTGYNFAGWRVMNVPSGYTRLEYIETSGTQYINTGIAQDTLNFQVDMAVSYADATTRYLFGVSSSSPMYFGRAASSYGATFEQNQAYTSLSSGVDTRVNLNWGKNDADNKMKLVVTIGDQTETLISSQNGSVTNKNFVLVANNGSSINSVLKGRIYYVKIYKSGSLVFYGIPARNSSNVVGMYDTVSKSFFTNSGSGTFGAGPDL